MKHLFGLIIVLVSSSAEAASYNPPPSGEISKIQHTPASQTTYWSKGHIVTNTRPAKTVCYDAANKKISCVNNTEAKPKPAVDPNLPKPNTNTQPKTSEPAIYPSGYRDGSQPADSQPVYP